VTPHLKTKTKISFILARKTLKNKEENKKVKEVVNIK
jgi:hypothetical protein